MAPHDKQLDVCIEKFDRMKEDIERHNRTFERLWEKINRLEIKVAVLAAGGGLGGGIIGAFVSKYLTGG